MAEKRLRVLVVEDSETDADLMIQELRRNGFDPEWQRVESEADYQAQLQAEPDVILCDFRLPRFNALRALEVLQETGRDTPFLIVSGAIGEDLAVQVLSRGAADYIIKDRMARLAQAVANALEQKQLRLEKAETDRRLRNNERRFRALIERSADVVILLDAQGRVQYSGPSLVTVLGYQPEEWHGRALIDFVHPVARKRLANRIQALASKQASASLNLAHEFRHGNGHWCWMEGVATNWLHESSVEAIVLNLRDISERKQAQLALQRAHNQLELRVQQRTAELADEKSRLELLYRLSQDLATTLNPREVADLALGRITTALNVLYAEIFVCIPGGQDYLRLLTTAGYPKHLESVLHGQHHSVAGDGLVGEVARARTAVVRSNVLIDESWRASLRLDKLVCSAAAVPLLAGDELIGVLHLLSDQDDFFQDDQLPLLLAVATPLALSLQNAQLYDQVHSGREQLRRLTNRVVTAQEEERHRLSYQLHDETGQVLSALQMNLSLIRDDLAPELVTLRQRMNDAVMLTVGTIDHVRSLAQTLRPPALDVVGLSATLEKLCHDVTQRTRLAIYYSGKELPSLSDALRISFYRFLQEALQNINKHAQARKAEVVLDYDGAWVSLEVIDDGRGFDLHLATTAPESGVIGLLGLQERFTLLGGRLTIESQPGQGTRLVALAPWQEQT
jgi:PAS domain S-box-containing protein